MENAAGPSNTLFYCSLVGFTVVSWLLWKCVFSPPPAQTASSTSSASAATAAGSAARAGASTVAARTRTSSTRSAVSTPSSSVSTKNSEDGSFSFGQPRHPPHFAPPANWTQHKTNLSGCLLQGVVPFRSTPASGYEVCLQKNELASANNTTTTATKEEDKSSTVADLIVLNRRERARIFARMFSSQKGARPPNRGANIVVTIQHSDVSCDKLQKTLYLLGTYYNLFVLVDGSGGFDGSSDEEVMEYIKKLRAELLNQESSDSDNSNQYKLNAQIIPPHRIAFSSTSKGRIAFVRQLHGAELVVDCEEDVTKELERFGFRVLLYPKNNEGTVVSSLGKFLIP